VETNSLSGTVTNSIDHTSNASNTIKSNNYSVVNGSAFVDFTGATVELTNTTVDFNGATITNFPTSDIGTWVGPIAQEGANTAQLGSTTWNAASVINATGATPQNFSLLGASGNSVDNAALPATITKDVSNALTSTTSLQRGTAGTGGFTTVISKNYTLGTSNTTGTICTISGVSNTAADKWKLNITIQGTTSGTSTGEAASASFTLLKAGVAGAWRRLDQPAFSSDTAKIGIPTATFSAVGGTVTLTQPTTTTNDGAVHYNVECVFTPLNSASIATPTLS
jgi:hypothetical protein